MDLPRPVPARALLLPVALLGAGACSDTSLNQQVDANNATPDIVVSPATLDFGAVPVDGVATAEILVQNQGNAALDVTDLTIDGAAFSLDGAASVRVEAGGAASVTLSYTPVNATDNGTATFYSNDPDDPAVPVALAGRGAFPQLRIDPSPVALGDVELCDEGRIPVALENAGEAGLNITETLLTGSGLSMDGLPELPLVVAPGDAVEVDLVFDPGRVGGVAGELWVESDDPAGARKATVSATGVVDGRVSMTDEHRQVDGPWGATDVMFFVDRSCSMKDDEANLNRNITQLAAELDAADSDWQMMVTIDDFGCSEGDFITPETDDVEGAFGEALATAPGTFTEAGLTIATRGLERSVGGGCNAGFLRSDSKTLVVTVSDEPEQSEEEWSHYTSRMQAIAPSVAVVAVVGDLPDGCDTAAPGEGYVEAAEATGGVFLSICDADWGRYFDVVGELATGEPRSNFALSQQPDPDTIEVTVDGEATSRFTWRSDSNEVVLENQPGPLSLVVISYDLGRECPDPGGDTGA